MLERRMIYKKKKWIGILLDSFLDESKMKFYSGDKSSFFYVDSGDMYKYFSPEFSKKGDLVRIKGWVGLFPKWKRTGELISFDEIESNGGFSISIRLENFPNASVSGIFRNNDNKINHKFIESIQDILKNDIPNSLEGVRNRIELDEGWIPMIIRHDVNNIYKKAIDIIL